MTIEQKAKAYDEAIERAKKVLLDCTPEEQKVVEYISPELKESKDERIRKWCVNLIKTTCDYDSPTSRKEVDDAIDWLKDLKQRLTNKQ